MAVAGLDPAARPQAVAVEAGADHRAVGEGDGRGAVPGLHQGGVESVEVAQALGQIGALLERLGLHHHQRVRQRAAAEDEELEDVVERRRIGDPRLDHGLDLLDVIAEELRGELRLASPHPVDVAAQRVDLAVVADHPVGMGELPARERVGREARMDERHRRAQPRISEVRKEERKLRRGQHALVDDRSRREARDRDPVAEAVLDHPADHIELALQIEDFPVGRAVDEDLADVRRDRPGVGAAVLEVDRHVAPA